MAMTSCYDHGKREFAPRLIAAFAACLFVVSAFSLSGCSGTPQEESAPQTEEVMESESSEDSSEVSGVPDKLAEAMKSVPGCSMTIEQDSDVTWTLYEDHESVGSVALDHDNETVTILIDSDGSDAQAERMAQVMVASVLACNPSYEYSEAQDIAYEILMEDEYRDSGISYTSGTKGDRFALVIEM